ncbi:MAG: division/cell wall cluster transcriptional repressor MraZ [Actinomycetota bacterium]|nr:division/cell wall cluster transcriptional repressor MraZ [Actinomycetota bacterium]
MSFTGEFRHNVDAKGRLIVPSRLRDQLGKTVVLSTWMDGCIAMWSEGLWDTKVAEPMMAERNSDRSKRSAARWIAASAHSDEIDSQGRITVPQSLKDHAGIDREVVIVGSFDHAEIWAPLRWQEEKDRGAEGGLEAAVQELNF